MKKLEELITGLKNKYERDKIARKQIEASENFIRYSFEQGYKHAHDNFRKDMDPKEVVQVVKLTMADGTEALYTGAYQVGEEKPAIQGIAIYEVMKPKDHFLRVSEIAVNALKTCAKKLRTSSQKTSVSEKALQKIQDIQRTE